MAEIVAQVGEGGSKHKLRRLLLGLGVVLLVAVLAAAAGAGARWLQHRKEYSRAAKPEAVNKDVSAAQNLTFNGNFDKAHETISKALDNPNLSAQAKYDLYMQEGVMYETQQKNDAAMESYRKAEAAKETMDVAQSIARMAEAKGDKQLAITYYKKAITLIPQDDALRDSAKKYFEDKITELEGGTVNHDN